MSEDKNILLILDLDETLIHSLPSGTRLDYDFKVFDYEVIKRPYLEHFIFNCSKYFRLAVWSSGSDDYVEEIVKHIFPDTIKPEFVWGRSRATYCPIRDIDTSGIYDPGHFYYIKKLKKIKPLGYTLEKTIIIDDTPSKSKDNYGNAIYVKAFTGEADDRELLFLAEYLIGLKDCKDVRKIEKRGWRNTIKTSL